MIGHAEGLRGTAPSDRRDASDRRATSVARRGAPVRHADGRADAPRHRAHRTALARRDLQRARGRGFHIDRRARARAAPNGRVHRA